MGLSVLYPPCMELFVATMSCRVAQTRWCEGFFKHLRKSYPEHADRFERMLRIPMHDLRNNECELKMR